MTEDGQKVENGTIFYKRETAKISWYHLIRNEIKSSRFEDPLIFRIIGYSNPKDLRIR